MASVSGENPIASRRLLRVSPGTRDGLFAGVLAVGNGNTTDANCAAATLLLARHGTASAPSGH